MALWQIGLALILYRNSQHGFISVKQNGELTAVSAGFFPHLDAWPGCLCSNSCRTSSPISEREEGNRGKLPYFLIHRKAWS